MCYFSAKKEKIEQYERIQTNLMALEPNASDDQITEFINSIPPELLSNKEDLMVICEQFSIYGRTKNKTKKRNIFKLFEGIMSSIQKHLNDHSKFFWNITGGLFYVKLWMYEQGLISIDTIILSIKKDKQYLIANYFLPELIEKEPEIFENEIKHHLKCPYSDEYVQQFKEKRQKYLKWLCESGDFSDPLFKEIETDPLKYALITDDIDSFQRIISNSNMDINSRIRESLIQNSHLWFNDESLLEFAFENNATKITKFLLMNNAELSDDLFFFALIGYDFDMIHLLESKKPDKFACKIMRYSLSTWNNEMIDYVLDNYDQYDFLEKTVDINCKNKDEIFEIIHAAFTYMNISFIKSKLIPFLNKNIEFVNNNIHDILNLTFDDQTGFLTKEFLNNPNIDINYYKDSESLLGRAIEKENAFVIELMLKNEQIDVNKGAFQEFPPLVFACGNYADMKIIKLLFNHPDININLRDGIHNLNSFEISIARGNFYALQYFIESNSELDYKSFDIFLYFNLKSKFFKTLKIALKYFLKIEKNVEFEKLVDLINQLDYDKEIEKEQFDYFKIIYDELNQ